MAYTYSFQHIKTELSRLTNKAQNKEDITLIWYDPNISSYKDTEQIKQQIRPINDYIIFSTNIGHCIQLIHSINTEKIFLATSASTIMQILSRTSSCHNIYSIFIFSLNKSPYEYLLNEYNNIIGIYTNLHDLYQSIKEQIDLANEHLQTFSYFDQNMKLTKDYLSKESAVFLWFQLFYYAMARSPQNQYAKQEMLHACKEYYREILNEIKLIQDFEETYQSKNTICCYLSQTLQREHQKILFSTETFLDVYRGIQRDREEFEKLKESQGKLISPNGYLSKTRRKSFALQRAMKSRHANDMVVPVIFHIRCDIKQINQSISFADIDQFSQYPEEQEVLFDLNACFLIESIEETLSLTTVTMSLSNKGHRSMKDYVELIQKDTNTQSISIIFGKLLCDLGEYDQSIKFLNLISYDSTDVDRAWIEFNIGRNFDFKEEYNEARKHYNYAYDRMMRNRPVRMKDVAHVLKNIGLTLHHQNKYDEVLSYHKRALRIREKLYSSNHSNIAQSFNNLALILSDQGKYDKAFIDYL